MYNFWCSLKLFIRILICLPLDFQNLFHRATLPLMFPLIERIDFSRIWNFEKFMTSQPAFLALILHLRDVFDISNPLRNRLLQRKWLVSCLQEKALFLKRNSRMQQLHNTILNKNNRCMYCNNGTQAFFRCFTVVSIEIITLIACSLCFLWIMFWQLTLMADTYTLKTHLLLKHGCLKQQLPFLARAMRSWKFGIGFWSYNKIDPIDKSIK